MEFHVRSARLTDVDAAVSLLADEPTDAQERRGNADRLRTLLFVPAATVVVAEADRRVIGVGVLGIRPAVRPGPFIGVIAELGIGSPLTDGGGGTRAAGAALRSSIGDSLVEHLVVSARNKGCAWVEVTDPLARRQAALLKRAGFARQGTLLSRAVV